MSPERKPLFKWVGPYYAISMGLIGDELEPIQINSLRELAQHKVGAVRGTLPDQMLSAFLNGTNYERLSEPMQGIRMLAMGRLDLFAHVLEVSSYLMRVNGINPLQYEEK